MHSVKYIKCAKLRGQKKTPNKRELSIVDLLATRVVLVRYLVLGLIKRFIHRVRVIYLADSNRALRTFPRSLSTIPIYPISERSAPRREYLSSWLVDHTIRSTSAGLRAMRFAMAGHAPFNDFVLIFTPVDWHLDFVYCFAIRFPCCARQVSRGENLCKLPNAACRAACNRAAKRVYFWERTHSTMTPKHISKCS